MAIYRPKVLFGCWPKISFPCHMDLSIGLLDFFKATFPELGLGERMREGKPGRSQSFLLPNIKIYIPLLLLYFNY